MKIKINFALLGVCVLAGCGGDDSSGSSSSIISSTFSSSSVSSSAPLGALISEEGQSGLCSYDGDIESEHNGFSGSGYINTENAEGAAIVWQISADGPTSVSLGWHYANGGDTRSAALYINNQLETNGLSFSGGTAWDDWRLLETTVSLQEGANTLSLRAMDDGGLPNVDRLELEGVGIVVGDCATASSSIDASSSNSSSVSPASSEASSEDSASRDPYIPPANIGDLSSACLDLVTNPSTNWRESALQTDQEIVKCLADSLGRPLGYGERATGGFDPSGYSKLVVISKNAGISPEQQVLDAISSNDFNWIVFDKNDFASDDGLAMYRLHCSDSSVLAALGGASEAECRNHTLWCSNRGINSDSCAATFFNERLNDKDLPIRNEMIHSNTTIDGRGSNATFLFNGFKIGADSSGQSTFQSQNVILTHLLFKGAGHTEDHGLDPDMIRSTGESHDIWIHKNTFSVTGDSAFDVKVGAYDITISFNRIFDVKRSTLHGSSDSREINSQITTTMHHNAFVTSDAFYDQGRSTARRVPLLRRGSSHMYNNLFVNYLKDFASVRVGATLLLEDNIFLGASIIQNEKSDLAASFDEWVNERLSDGVLDEGYFSTDGSRAYFSSDACVLNPSFQAPLVGGNGGARDLSQDYSDASRQRLFEQGFEVGQDLVDYVNLTAGKYGETPFNSPLTAGRDAILNLPQVPCLQQ